MKLFARLGEEIIFKVYFTRKNDIWTINNDKINPTFLDNVLIVCKTSH